MVASREVKRSLSSTIGGLQRAFSEATLLYTPGSLQRLGQHWNAPQGSRRVVTAAKEAIAQNLSANFRLHTDSAWYRGIAWDDFEGCAAGDYIPAVLASSIEFVSEADKRKEYRTVIFGINPGKWRSARDKSAWTQEVIGTLRIICNLTNQLMELLMERYIITTPQDPPKHPFQTVTNWKAAIAAGSIEDPAAASDSSLSEASASRYRNTHRTLSNWGRYY